MRRGLFILCGMLLSMPSFASSITVSGSVSGTWSADTVFVAGQVQITPGNTLVIRPGVKVLFLVQAKFIVGNSAILTAVGTATDSIRFDGYPEGSEWNGLRFYSASDTCRLAYCFFRHGLATGVGDDNNGGAIFCNYTNLVVSHCKIANNQATGAGGGLYISGVCSPHISYNTIMGNAANGPYPSANGGGIGVASPSTPEIDHNYITLNQANVTNDGYGGGIYFEGSANIHDNLITGNHAWAGGGLQGSNAANAILHQNKIDNNTALVGGGMDCIGCSFTQFDLNEFCHNSASTQAGALFFNSTSPVINKNTFADNNAGFVGGLYLFAYSRPQLINCIVWGNTQQQFYMAGNSNAIITYTDVQGSWTGTGNVESDPHFINTAQNDYRLNWGTLCINGGDPNPIYHDPDGTRADMGAHYFDFAHPVRVTLTPFNAPFQIPGGGGNFTFEIELSNTTFSSHLTTVAANIILPSGATYGPVLGPFNLNVAGVSTLIRFRNQTVPAGAPAGQYFYQAYAAVGTDTSWDSFAFTKAGSRIQDAEFGTWANTGEDFSSDEIAATGDPSPTTTVLHSAFPNPFNPTTVLSYELRVSSQVSLKVYDTAGRLVTVLVDGWREAGVREVTFDGSNLASGIYMYTLTAGSQTTAAKMVLLK